MKKLILAAALIFGLSCVMPMIVQASGHTSSCATCKDKKSKCKITKLKKKVKMLWAHKDALEITDEQFDKIKSVKHQAMKDLIQQDADVKIVAVDLKSQMWEDMIDVAVVNKLIDQKFNNKAKAKKTYVKALADIQKVLTEEQRSKFRDMCISKKMNGDSWSACTKCQKKKGQFCPITGKWMGGNKKGSGYEAKGSSK